MTATAASGARRPTTDELRQVAVSVAVGTTTGFYAFFLFGTAAAGRAARALR